MMWEEDLFKEEKLSLLDAILRFSYQFRDKRLEEIPAYQMTNFIDEFFKRDKYCISCHNLKIACRCGSPHTGCHYQNHRRNDMEWISVKDQTPSQGRYLIMTKCNHRTHKALAFDYPHPCGKINIAYFDQWDKKWYYSTGEKWDKEVEISHWMPLPEPPKENEQ